MFDVLEHIDDDLRFLMDLAGLLVPGGLIYITVPAFQFLWAVDDENAQHKRRYTLASLKAKLEQAGFKIKFESYIFWFLPLPIFIFRTLPTPFKMNR